MESKTDKVIKDIAQTLLKKLDIEGTCDVVEKEGIYELTIKTEESGLLIGYHGNTLNSFQLILSTLVFKKTSKWERVVVNIGDYRQKREETLKSLAEQYAEQVINTQQVVVLPYFSASERRIIHLALQDHPQVLSESVGDGKERRLTIKPKNSA